jgi:RNA polymerase sigma-70 factor (ECF subfamily)
MQQARHANGEHRLNPETEHALLTTARHEPQAFRELYHHYFPRVYGYVAARVGHVPDAEDVVSTIFLKAVGKLHHFQYRGAGSFAAWLFSIAHNEVSQFYRARPPDPLPLDELPDVNSRDLSPDQQLVRREQFTQLYALIGTLSPRRQEILTLRFFGELRNQEIAAVLGLDERTVASHLCRALEDLQRKYAYEAEKENQR